MQGFLAFLTGMTVALTFVNVTHSYFHPYCNIHKEDDKFTVQTEKGSYPEQYQDTMDLLKQMVLIIRTAV